MNVKLYAADKVQWKRKFFINNWIFFHIAIKNLIYDFTSVYEIYDEGEIACYKATLTPKHNLRC